VLGIALVAVIVGVSASLGAIGNGEGSQAGAKGKVLEGTNRPDRIFGTKAADVIRGYGGGDLLVGGAGADQLYGGRGNDTVRGRDGRRDFVHCGPGRDLAQIDNADKVVGCERISRSRPGSTPPPPTNPDPPGPPPPPPSPPVPPPPSGGTKITINGQWVCDQPLSQYGALPIVVDVTLSNSASLQLRRPGAVRLEESCTAGGRDGEIDLYLRINGNGENIGSHSDGLILVGAHDMDIGGYVNCGRVRNGAHQDGVQMNSAFRLNFIGFTSGDWDNQRATCHGAGGVWYVSQLDDVPNLLQDVVCFRCKFVGTNPNGGGAAGRAFGHYGSLRSGARDSCFAANHPYTLRDVPSPLPAGYLDRSGGGAVQPINHANVFIDLNSSDRQPRPSDCRA
jgi:Ca2+-binding RTX toxin-like protein